MQGRVREICARYEIADRMPRPILPDDPLAANKKIAEKLFLRAYGLTLDEANSYRVWAYRKAAWAIDEMGDDIESIYRRTGRKGLQSVKGVGKTLSTEIEGWLQRSL